jgi:subtilisin
MIYKKAGFLTFFLIAVLVSCKDDETPEPDKVDDCLTTSSVKRGDIIPGEYIVSFPAGPANGRVLNVTSILERHNIAREKISDVIQGEAAHYIVNLSIEQATALSSESSILRLEPDRVISICGCFTVLEPSLVTWNVDKVGYGDGAGKTAWIMDTGIDMDHPDLNVDKSRSRSFISDVSSPEDDNGHGTHVAGIVGAKNNTIGTLGVASGATVVSLKILDKEGNGRLSTALKALSYIKSNGKAGDAINISLTLDEISESLETEIRSVANNGMYVAIAAGNDSKDASTFSPARTAGANIYTVSAVDSLNQFANFSNYGAQAIDYAAPGVRILSTYIDGKYAIISGTSMASPHVAGLLLINQGKINANGFALNDPDGKPDPLAHQ